jgi:hypothetical protein
MSKCRFFIGIQHELCEAGVKMSEMRDVSQPGMARWPCVTFDPDKAATIVCPKRVLMTKEEHEAEVAMLYAAADRFATAVAAGKCPHCGADIEPSKIVGRCRYAACGHRVGQVDDGTEEP